MRYYIASSLDNVEQVKRVKARLDAAGWEHTYDWTVHGSVQREGLLKLQQVAANEADGVSMADVLIVLLPGGRGTHTELGMAIGITDCVVRAEDETPDIRICIYSPDPDKDFSTDAGTTCAFYFYPTVERFSGNLDGVIDLILGVAS